MQAIGLTVLLALAPAAILWAQPAAPASSAATSEFVGNFSPCQACHPAQTLNFFKNPHHKSVAAGGTPPENLGCEGCHGPAAKHVAARGGKASIIAFSELKPKQILDNCLRCHAKDFSRAAIRRSEHTRSDVVCTNCHSIHRPASFKYLLAREQRDVCYGCHASVRAQFNMPFKHRVNEGSVQCSDCHNPHGAPPATWRMSQRPRMVDHALANEQPCLKCHTDKRGPFLFEHAAVRVDGCETCHSPHGSMNARLLKRPLLFTLCLECHNGAESFGRQGDGVKLQSPSHNMADPRYQSCTTCHVRIHGSNADQRFLR